ncbi:MAG: IS3 family transposase [Anaerovoracaceae bacterium]
MKYEAISTKSPEFSVRKMCQVLGLSQSGYYSWKRRYDLKHLLKARERELATKVRETFEENKRVYRYRKIQIALEKKGIQLSLYKVGRIMRENGLYSIRRKKYKPFRNGKSTGKFFDNLLKQNFNPERLNEVWAGDITYIRTDSGWVYLAVVMDLFNREIIGYSVSKNIDTELAKRALCNALANTEKRVENLIFHSDKGIQYASKSYQKMLAENGITGSMSKAGCPYDNACLESFFSSAKRECILRKEYVTLEELKARVFEYIELFYNKKRIHQSLGYKSPVEYRISANC